MRKWLVVLGLLGLLAIAVPMHGNAATYTFVAVDGAGAPDMRDLDHYYTYLWGFNWSVPAGETITGAQLRFNNIYDWTYEADRLSIFLLDDINSTQGWTFIAGNGSSSFQKADYQSLAAVSWPASDVTSVGAWTDPYGDSAHKQNLVFDFASLGVLDEFSLASSTGSSGALYNFGFGLDPDCHYYNDGIEFSVTTTPVPEPGSFLLLACGLAAVIAGGRRKKTA